MHSIEGTHSFVIVCASFIGDSKKNCVNFLSQSIRLFVWYYYNSINIGWRHVVDCFMEENRNKVVSGNKNNPLNVEYSRSLISRDHHFAFS